MSVPSLLRDFRAASLTRKLRYVFWSAAGVAVTVCSVFLIIEIWRLHFLATPVSDRADEKLDSLQVAEETAAEQREQARAEKAKPVAEPVSGFSIPYEIRTMAVPIANRRLTKALYMQFTVIFDCPSQNALTVIQMNRAKLRSVLFEVAMHYNEEDFRTSAGFDAFRNEVLASLKAALGENAPRAMAMRDVLIN